MAKHLKEKIQFFRGDLIDDETLLDTKYGYDASLFHVKPALAAIPKDSEDIKGLISFVNEQKDFKLSITARSGGTDMTGGPLNESIILDMTKYFDHIKEIGNRHALVEPGVYYRDFEKETLRHNLLLPSYPASREICTVGGMVANNSGGEKTLTYGQTKDYVTGLKVILADGNEYEIKPLNKEELNQKMAQQNLEGEIYRKVFTLIEQNNPYIQEHRPHVSKNSSGYFLWDVWDGHMFDMTRLFTGSQGTLGIITEIKFRLIKPKKFSRLLVIFLHDLKLLAQVINSVLQHKPESFESYDDKTLKLAIKFLPSFVDLMGTKNILNLAWQFLPEFGLIATGGMPKLVLLAEFTGDSLTEIDKKIKAARHDLKVFEVKTRITKSEEEAKKYWTIRRESFNLLRHKIKNKQTAPFIDDMVVKPEKLPDFLPRLDAILKPYKLTYSIAGHAGDGNFHIIPLMNLHDEKTKKIIPELSKKVYDLILEFHGSITGEHNDGLIRSPFLKQMYGEKMYHLFQEVKNIFDPNNIFNPGKKVNSDFAYAMSHLK